MRQQVYATVDLAEVMRLGQVCAVRMEAFASECGLVGKNVLDYPGGFRFSTAVGVREQEAQRFVERDPSYVVWSHTGRRGSSYTVAYWARSPRAWFYPQLVQDAPLEARRHQWLLSCLTSRPMPMPVRGEFAG